MTDGFIWKEMEDMNIFLQILLLAVLPNFKQSFKLVLKVGGYVIRSIYRATNDSVLDSIVLRTVHRRRKSSYHIFNYGMHTH